MELSLSFNIGKLQATGLLCFSTGAAREPTYNIPYIDKQIACIAVVFIKEAGTQFETYFATAYRPNQPDAMKGRGRSQ